MKIKIAFLLLIVILFFGSIFYINYQFYPKNKIKSYPILFQIKRGDNLNYVINELYKRNLIKSPKLTKIYATLKGLDKQIKPGYYLLSSNMTTYEILDKIIKGQIERIRITIPEGYTVKQIAELLESYNFSSKKYFDYIKYFIANQRSKYTFLRDLKVNDNIEGYLYPDTYLIAVDEFELVKQQFDRFNEIIMTMWNNRPSFYKYNLKQTLTLASIVEKEAVKDFERPIIAGVFFNRLAKGIPLGADPTVEYALGWHQGDKGLTYNDVKINSPYNTYIYPGLPPTPICNPGKDSFKATLYPAKTHYFYFVAKGDGTHYFSTNEQEHERAKIMIKKGILR